MLEINEKNKDGILSKKGLIMVKVGANFCGPCRAYNRILETLGEQYPIYALDTDDSPNLANEWNIRAIPVSIFFNDGVEVKRIVGLQGAPAIINFFAELT